MWVAASDLAGLPELPSTDRNVRAKAQREDWQTRTVAAPGGPGGVRQEYHILSLPAAARAALLDAARRVPAAQANDEPDAAPINLTPYDPVDPSPVTTHLADWQRRVMDARAVLLDELDRLALILGQGPAVAHLVNAARADSLAEPLADLVPVANARSGAAIAKGCGSRTLSDRSLRRWARQRADHGVAGLAPRAAADPDLPDWGQALLRLYQRPTKPSLQQCLRDLPGDLPDWMDPPSYDQARRFLSKMDAVEREMGRRGPNGVAALRGFVRRDTRDLRPLDVVSADGHTHKCDVQHPATGRPFRPEVVAVIDAATRKVIGWSAGLAENAHVVMDALRHTVITHGVAAIFYSDNGPGFIARAMTDEVVGFRARIGIHHETSRPGRPQGRGMIERLQASLWIDAAKRLPGYAGPDMDREARKRIQKATKRDLARTGSSRLLQPWDQFLAWCQDAVDAYNDRPHTALPRLQCSVVGRMRHQTPNEAWAGHLSRGWKPVTLSDDTAMDLWRPYEERVVQRAEVRLPWGRYYSAALEPWHGETVRVGYEIHDGSRVWVRDLDGRLIATAQRDGNLRPYMPASKLEHARNERAQRRLALLDEKRRDVEVERRGTITLTAQPLEPDARAAADAEYDRLCRIEAQRNDQPLAKSAGVRAVNAPVLPAATGTRPVLGTDDHYAAWLLAHPSEVTQQDRAELKRMLRKEINRAALEAVGIDVRALAALAGG